MLKSFRAKTTSIFFWVIVVLLIIGLAGIGIGTGGLARQTIASVGDRDIDRDDFLRAFDQEMRAIGQQLGRPLTTAEARQFGVDRFVLSRLVNDAALDNEAERLGLSTGDAEVSRQVLAQPAFQGIDGSFDRDAYRFALERMNLSVRDFETQVRDEATRELVAASLQAPAAMPEVAGLTVLGFLGERRAFDWLALGPDQLEEPVLEPGEDELAAFHDAHPERYTRPETRQIAYAILTPEAVAAGIEVSEEALRAAYDAAGDRFAAPERRFVDRIGFGTAEEAAAARARLDAGEIGFEALAAERGFSARDIDQGLLAARDLATEAREAVFGADGPGIVGPVGTPLGPSLYRINGIIDGQTTAFEDARGELRAEIAAGEAREQVLALARGIDDLIAGGATVEEIAAETEMELGEVALNDETTDGVAGDPAFREAALAAREGAETDLVELEDGSVATLRVDAVVPPTLLPLDEVRARVAEDWRAEAAAERLAAAAEGYRAELEGGLGFAELAERLGLEVQSVPPITRGEIAPGAPPELVAELFELEPGHSVVLTEPGAAILARLDRIEPFDPAGEEGRPIVESVRAELARQAADDMLALTARALQAEAGVRVNEQLLESTLAALP